MAKNEVKVTLKVDDNGNLKKTGTKAKKAAKDIDKLGRSTKNADRNMKGLSQQSSNSSKNFSKMAQGMNGGLVPAYATLAAQIFAVTALFRFLQQAADYRVLIEGQKAFAAETGIAYNTITKSLQNATDGQLAFKDAAQAAAIGSAAGVTPDQLERLAVGARNVSIALGRDLTDSFNRLIRGTTKAEPELLDELGIILRLDDATRNYAATIGKTKETLTIFEKSQAVTNEVLAQVEGKFGSIGENADLNVNALNQFGKAFDDVINKIYEFIGPMAEGLARFFSKNLYAFMGALTIFAIPIIKIILPSMDAWTAKTVEAAKLHKAAYISQKADLTSYQATLAKAKAGAGVNRGLFQQQATKMGISTSGRGKAAAIRHFENETTKIVADANYKRTGVLKNATTQQVAILKKSYTRMMADTKGTTTWVNRQWQTMGLQFKVVNTGMKTAWAGTMAFMKKTASKAGKFMNKAFSILMVFSVLVMIWDMIKPLLGMDDKEDPHADALEAAKNLNKELKLMGDRFRQRVGGGTGNTLMDGIETLVFKSNAARSADLEGRLQSYNEATGTDRSGLTRGLITTLESLGQINPEFLELADNIQKSGNVSGKTQEAMLLLSKTMQSGGAAAKQLKDALTDLNKAKNSYIQSKAKLPFDSLVTPSLLGAEGARESFDIDKASYVAVARAKKAAQDNLDTFTPKTMRMTDPSATDSDYKAIVRAKRAHIKSLDDEMKALNKSGVAFRKQAEDLEAYAAKYIGFSVDAAVNNRAKTDLTIDSHVALAGRSGGAATAAKQEIATQQKLLDIDNQRIAIKVANELFDETEKGTTAYLQAEQMVKNEEKKLELYQQQKLALMKLKDPLMQIEVAALNAFESGLQNAMMGVIDGTKTMKEGFLDMAKAVLQAIAQIIVKLIAMKAIQAMGFGFADGGVIPMANGGIKPKGYRSGGVVTEPTYLAGEGKYNEAVVPLPDGRSIPVMMKGSSGGNANVTVNISADGQATENITSDGGVQGAQLGRAISAAVQEEMHKQQRPGGILSPYGG